MQQRPLGSTGMTVSALGYGAFKIGRNRQHRFAADYDLPTEAEASQLLNAALDAGITLIDTAPAYGLSEERIGRTISHRREEYLLSTKVGEEFDGQASSFDFSAAAVRGSIERSLTRLKTDRLDVVFVHSSGDDLAVQQQTDVVETLQILKSQGLFRTIGFSGKTTDGLIAALEWADVLMVPFSSVQPEQAAVIAQASSVGVGVIVKKGLASGQLPPRAAIEYILKTRGVNSLLIGTLSRDHLGKNIAIVEDWTQ